jgi:hypothetical protein
MLKTVYEHALKELWVRTPARADVERSTFLGVSKQFMKGGINELLELRIIHIVVLD